MKKLLVLLIISACSSLLAQPERGNPFAHLMRLDSDGNGDISQAEFIAGAEKHFAALDANADGILTADELKEVRHAHRAERHQMIGAHILLRADADDDGLVSAIEWGDFVTGLETDENGAITLGQFMRHAGPEGAPSRNPLDFNGNDMLDTDDLTQLFAKYDANGDKVLDDSELGYGHPGRHGRHGAKGDGALRRHP